MSDPKNGPVMLVATEALRPPPLRIGKLGPNFTLPRTVPAIPLLVGGLTAIIFAVAFSLIIDPTIPSIMYSATIGGLVGTAAVSYSPLRGESLLRWFGLKYKSTRNRSRMVDGKPVRLAVGICYVSPPISGAVGIRPGSIPVRPGLFDDRGVRIRETRWVSEYTLQESAKPRSRKTSGDPYEEPLTPRQTYRQDRLAAYKAASSEPALPDDLVPTLPDPTRRFGRWSQDAAELRRLYDTIGSPTSTYETAPPALKEPSLPEDSIGDQPFRD